jgi:hypothetical protein
VLFQLASFPARLQKSKEVFGIQRRDCAAVQSKRTRNCKGNPKANHRGAQRKAFFRRRFALIGADFNLRAKTETMEQFLESDGKKLFVKPFSHFIKPNIFMPK